MAALQLMLLNIHRQIAEVISLHGYKQQQLSVYSYLSELF
jgi:hypothetical protein